MVEFGSAIKRPFLDFKTFILGVILSLIPIVNFVTTGFGIKNAQMTFNNDNSLAKWGGFVDLFIKGIVVLVICIVYFIPAAIVLFLAAATVFFALLSAFSPSAGAYGPTAAMQALTGALVGGGALILVALILGIITVFLLPMALMFYARENSFGAAFRLGAVIKSALTGTYFVAWIVAIIYSILISVILAAIIGGLAVVLQDLATALGYILLGLLFYTLTVTNYSIFAQALKEVQGTGTTAK